MNTLTLAFHYFQNLDPSLRLNVRLERTSMRWFDGQKTTDELYREFVAAFGADGHL